MLVCSINLTFSLYTGVYNTLSAVELPLGAPIFILFDVFDLFLPLVSTYNFYPLNHVISSSAPNPNFTPAGEGTVVSVSFSNASPSLTGTYVLCFDAVPPSRRRRIAEPVFERNTFECGGKVNVTVLSKLYIFASQSTLMSMYKNVLR